MDRIAIQGIDGCNHFIAAQDYFAGRDIACVDCDTFTDLADTVEKDPSILGIMAVENTIAGSILQNYKLIESRDLVIVGEYKLRIKHALAALPGVEISDIREVNSHPMALRQCAEYLENLPGVKLVEKDDTAGSARWISQNCLRDHAAICPAGAAALYGMNVLADGIETNKRNFTRFLILAHESVADLVLKDLCPEGTVNKSTLLFTLQHTAGSLSKVLSVLSFYDMNLTMIQSVPIIGKEWEYQFYINLLYADYHRYRQAIDAIRPLTGMLKILGEYEDGRQSVAD